MLKCFTKIIRSSTRGRCFGIYHENTTLDATTHSIYANIFRTFNPPDYYIQTYVSPNVRMVCRVLWCVWPFVGPLITFDVKHVMFCMHDGCGCWPSANVRGVCVCLCEYVNYVFGSPDCQLPPKTPATTPANGSRALGCIR